jgi:hypothetical protein
MQKLSLGKLIYQPQTPLTAMIKANKIITEAVIHFLSLTSSLLPKIMAQVCSAWGRNRNK